MSYADDKTEEGLKRLEKRIKALYEKAFLESKAEAEKYFEEYERRYMAEWKKWKAGQYTDAQFTAWVQTQLSRGERWEEIRDNMAQKYVDANKTAAEYINGQLASTYTVNANWAAYEISRDYEDISFDLIDENVVKNLITDADNYTEFKTVSTNPIRDYEWNSKQIQTALTAGILQGKSIDKLADSFMVVQKRNRNAAIRNARTAVTSAENAGRMDTMRQAEAQGIQVRKRWLATSDARTRDSHAHLNGQIRDIDDPFDNGLMYPGDADGAPAEVYNCRCTLTYIYPRYDKHVKSNESYMDWLKEKQANIGTRKNNENTMSRSRKHLNERANELNKELDSIITSKSLWNGRVVKIKRGDNSPNRLLANQTMYLHANASDVTIIHELLHGRSYLVYGQKAYEENASIEEMSVEFMAREIAKQKKMKIGEADDNVKALELLNTELGLYDSNFKFAQALLNMPLPDRKQWLINKIEWDNLKEETITKVIRALSEFGDDI